MSKFFVNRPIVAIVISIITFICGALAITALPVSLFPDITPPEIVVTANYIGADALTVEQSVATPIEQQMSGVDNMNYMYSLNSSTGLMTLTVDFDNPHICATSRMVGLFMGRTVPMIRSRPPSAVLYLSK